MRVVTVGTGMAATEFVQRLRLGGFTGDIEMLGDEDFPPYSPCVIPFFLAGEPLATVFWKGADFYERYRVRARLGDPVVEVDAGRKQVRTAQGTKVAYDKLFFATGGRSWFPKPEWLKTRGVFGFKTLTDLLAIDRHVRETGARRAVVFGGGFIGVDAALALWRRGLEVSIVHRNTRLLSQMTDEDGGRFATARIARKTGIDVRLRATVEEVRANGGQLAAVRLATGEWLETPLLVVSIGVSPNAEPLGRAGEGVAADEQMLTDPDVYVAGDVARTRHRITGATGLYATYPNAMSQAHVAAQHLLTGTGAFPGSVNTNVLKKHIDFPIVSAGSFSGEPVTWQRGDVWRRVYLKDGRINGYLIVGEVWGSGHVYQLYVSQKRVDRTIGAILSRPGPGSCHGLALVTPPVVRA
jgi:NAD(P)H-nitrite reductase large subunit